MTITADLRGARMTREAASLPERVLEPDGGPVSVLFVEEERGCCGASYVGAAPSQGVAGRRGVERGGCPREDRGRPARRVVVTEADFGGVLDGFELARRINVDPIARHLPVVVLTDTPIAEVARSVLTGHCSACVPKPCEPDAVIIAVKSVIAIAELLAQRRALGDRGLGSGWWQALR